MGLQKGTYKVRCVTDIVFCIDCSFSMIPIIESIKKSICLLMNGIENADISIDWRARVVGFRDNIVYNKPFVTSLDDVKTQLDSVKAQGVVENGFSPIIETIECVLKDSAWRERTHRIIMLFTDTAPGSGDPDSLSDEVERRHIKLYLWGKKDPVYDYLMKIPRAEIEQFNDPIEYYYHKTVEFGDVLESLDPRNDPEYLFDAIDVL